MPDLSLFTSFKWNFTIMTQQFAEQLNTNQSKQQPSRLKKIFIPLIIIIVAIAVFMLMMFSAPKPEKKPVENKAPLVNVAPINVEHVDLTVQSQGTIQPIIETNLIAEVSGRIIEVSPNFNNGGYFEKGEVILKINDEDYQIALLQAQARLDGAKAALLEEQARSKQAKDEWLLSGKPLTEAPLMALRTPQLQKAQADINLANADVESAKIKLTRTVIRAPYTGILKSKQVDIGQFVNMGSILATSFAIESAEIRLPIKTQDIPFLVLPKVNQNNGDAAKVELSMSNANSHHTWQAQLSRYEGEVDSLSRVHYVVATVSDPYNIKQDNNMSHQTSDFKPELRIGSFVNAVIAGKKIENVVVIPRNVVIGKNTLNLIDKDNKLVIKNFSIIHSDHQNLYTNDVFPADLKIVVTELSLPVAGMPLRIADLLSQEGQ